MPCRKCEEARRAAHATWRRFVHVVRPGGYQTKKYQRHPWRDSERQPAASRASTKVLVNTETPAKLKGPPSQRRRPERSLTKCLSSTPIRSVRGHVRN